MNTTHAEEQLNVTLVQFQRFITKNINLYIVDTYKLETFRGEFFTILRRNFRDIIVGGSAFTLTTKNVEVKLNFEGRITQISFTPCYGGYTGKDIGNQIQGFNLLLEKINPDYSKLKFEDNVNGIVESIQRFKP